MIHVGDYYEFDFSSSKARHEAIIWIEMNVV
jgi:hypothetical protein